MPCARGLLRLNRIADSWDNSIHSFVRAACTRRPWMRQAIARDGTAYRTWRSHPAELQLLTPQTTGDLVAGFEVYPEPPTATLVYASPGKSWGLRRVAVRNPARFVVDRGAFDAPRAEAPVRLEP